MGWGLDYASEYGSNYGSDYGGTGYGDYGDGAAPDLPRLSRLDTLSNAVCAGPPYVYTGDGLTDNMLCGREQELSPCLADRGAPLLVYDGGAYSQVCTGYHLWPDLFLYASFISCNGNISQSVSQNFHNPFRCRGHQQSEIIKVTSTK